MTGAWSYPPLDRVASVSEIGEIGEKLSENDGESRFVAGLRYYPDWIYKEYRSAVPAQQCSQLDHLVRLPGQMTPADRALAESHISWPAVRVVNSRYDTTGVLAPRASERYYADLRGSGGRTQRKALLVDQLALPPASQQRILSTAQSLADRVAVCASIAAVGALFERHGLVYLDWSYANIFWSLDDHSCYVIDMDGSSFGPRPQIHSPGWDDPLVPLGGDAGNESDRYRVALLIARCLTGVRGSAPDARTALNNLRRGHSAGVEQVAELLILSLTAQSTRDRPTVERIKTALDAVNSGWSDAGTAQQPPTSIKGWKKVTPKPRAATRPTGSPTPRSTSKAPNVPPPPGPTPAPKPAPMPAPKPTWTPTPTSAFNVTRPEARRKAPASQTRQPAQATSGLAGTLATILIVVIMIFVLIAIFGT
jgi:hypothetical protein